MPKGFISQTVVVLFSQAVEINELKSLLTEFNVVKESDEAKDWEFSGSSLLLEYLPEVNGYVSIDVVNRPWPDHMGDPKNEVTLFGAWSMGWFGPFTFPGNLQRATQQSWLWPEGKEVAPTHTSFVRIRISYIFGAPENAAVLPENYEPLPELKFITSLASTLLQHPKALCYFNPNGEVLLSKSILDTKITFADERQLPPLPVWTNVRFFNLNPTWQLMDTMGNWQMDIADHEAAFPMGKFRPSEVEGWLRNITLYVLKNENVIKDRDTMDGPGNIRWQAMTFSNGKSAPPRKVLRWLPLGVSDIPPELLTEEGLPKKPGPLAKPKWKFW